jgi:cell division ATPase FtsA
MSFLGLQKKNNIDLIIEIQSSLIRVHLLLAMKNAQERLVIGAFESHFEYKEKEGSKRYVNTVKNCLSETLEQVHLHITKLKKTDPQSKLGGSIGFVDICLSSPWSTTQTKTISLDTKPNTEINYRHVDDILKNHKKQLQLDKNLAVIEEKVTTIKLNGYEVKNFTKHIASHLEISYIISISSRDFIKSIQAICKKYTTSKKIHYHSIISLLQLGIRDTFPDTFSGSIINIHGELSEVTVLDRGRNIFTASFPYGYKTLLRKVSEKSKHKHHSTDSLISMYEKNILIHSNNHEFEAIRQSLKEWKNVLDMTMKDLQNLAKFTKNITINSDQYKELFKTFLNSEFSGSTILDFNHNEILIGTINNIHTR